MSEKQKTNKETASLGEMFFSILGNIIHLGTKYVLSTAGYGFKYVYRKNEYFYPLLLLWLSMCLIAATYYLPFELLHYFFPNTFSYPTIAKIILNAGIPGLTLIFLSMALPLPILLCFIKGRKPKKKHLRYQKAIDNLGFKNASGAPKVLEYTELGDTREVVKVKSDGFGAKKYIEQMDNLQTSMGKIIEEIKPSKKLDQVDVFLTEKTLPEKCDYKEMLPLIDSKNSFIVGESRKGALVQSIRDLPHMLIAGTTGGGKSNFFNNVLLNLLESNTNTDFYLLDLKQGIETIHYKDFPNVQIADNLNDTDKMLTHLLDLMDARYRYLKSIEKRKVDLKRDKMNYIVVAIDEVAEIYSSSITDKKKKDLVNEIQAKADRLARQGRAAGFSIIFCTQKVKKEVLNTSIQSCIGGRMCFKMPNLVDSVTVLGNKKAFELDQISGRAIWNVGNEYMEIQAPMLGDSVLEEEITRLRDFYKEEKVKKSAPYKKEVMNDVQKITKTKEDLNNGK